jgi:hypothetical protein
MNFTRLFVILYSSIIFLVVSLRHRDHLQYLVLTENLVNPAKLFGRWRILRLSPLSFNIVGVCFLIALASAALGICARLALFLGVLLYFLYFGQIRTLSYVVRKSNLIPQLLLLMALAPGTNQPIHASSPQWPIFIAKMAVAQVYVSAAYSKLRNSGLRWATASQLQGILVTQHLKYDIPIANALASHRAVCSFLAFAVFSHQISFPIVLLYPGLEVTYVGAALLFHFGTLVTMRIDYLTYHAPAYLVFLVIPLGRLLSAVHQ